MSICIPFSYSNEEVMLWRMQALIWHDGHGGNVFDSDETSVNDVVTNQNTIASVVTEIHDSQHGHTFDSVLSRGIGTISLENTQTNEGEDDLHADDTLRNTAAEGNFTQTEVGSNASNVRQSPVRESPHNYKKLYWWDAQSIFKLLSAIGHILCFTLYLNIFSINILTSTIIDLTRNIVIMKSSIRRFTILWRSCTKSVSKLILLCTLRSERTRDGLLKKMETRECSQFYIMPYRRQNNSANTKLGCQNVARLRNYLRQSKRIPFAHPNTLPRLSTERLRTELLRL